MKQSLQLRLSQHLAMTPRLQQAIRLLQLSTLELHTEVQEALDSNLMLEPDEDDDPGAGGETEIAPADIPRELPVDSVWEDIYDSAPVNNTGSAGEFNGTDLIARRAQTDHSRIVSTGRCPWYGSAIPTGSSRLRSSTRSATTAISC